MPLPTRSDGDSGPMSRLLLPPVELNDVTEVGDSRPSLGEDGAGIGVNLGEADGAPSGTLKPKVGSSDAREEGGMGQVHPKSTVARRRRPGVTTEPENKA